MSFTFDENVVSDLYKSAYGVRPRGEFWARWNEMCAEEKQAEWEFLVERMEQEQEIEERREARAHKRWLVDLNVLMMQHGISMSDAIRWDMEAEGAAGDVGYYCYLRGIAYRHEENILRRLRAKD